MYSRLGHSVNIREHSVLDENYLNISIENVSVLTWKYLKLKFLVSNFRSLEQSREI